MSSFSLLRISGLILGLVFLVALFRTLRSAPGRRMYVNTFFLLGLGLIFVSLFPNIINLPAAFFSLSNVQGGRIITLLVITNIALFLFALRTNRKIYQMKFHVNQFIENVISNETSKNASNENLSEFIVVLIPAYNEAENLKMLLPKIPGSIHGKIVKALIVDDGSSDNTSMVAKANNAILIKHPFNRGGGAALRTGYQFAKQHHAGIIVTMDADGQHDPQELVSLVTPLLEKKADFVIGSRMLGSFDSYSRTRILGLYFFNFFLTMLMGIKVTDCSSGYRALNLSALSQIRLRQDQYHTAELIIDAAKNGAKILDVPIHVSPRHSGESKKGHNFFYAFRFLRTILTSWWA